MIERMKALLKEQDTCVLATSRDDRPHCSLMVYVTDEEGRYVYMVTLKKTKKYENLLKNPYVSLLVDTRKTTVPEGGPTVALTVTGRVELLGEDGTREKTLQRIAATRPDLKVLASDPDADIIAVRIQSFQLLEGPASASFCMVE